MSNGKISRRAAMGALAVGGLASPALSQGRKRLVMLCAWPVNSIRGRWAQRLCTRIRVATSETLDILIYGPNELIPENESFHTLAADGVDMLYDFAGMHLDETPAYVFFSSVPFGLLGLEHLAWLREGGGAELWEKINAEHGIHSIACASSGPDMGGWFMNAVNTPEDLDGLKIRCPEVSAGIYRRLGATPVPRREEEVAIALAHREIDAATLGSPAIDAATEIYETAKRCYGPNGLAPTRISQLSFNIAMWEKLAPSVQNLIETICEAEYLNTAADIRLLDAYAIAKMIREHGVNVHPFPKTVIERLRVEADDVVQEFCQEDTLAAACFDSYRRFRELMIGSGTRRRQAAWWMESSL